MTSQVNHLPLLNGNEIFSERDRFWMQHAVVLAKQAAMQGEVPVGAVVIYEDNIIGEGFNCSIAQQDPTAHAEIIALRQAGEQLNNYRLLNATLYVTLEPCIMCAGAMVHARIKKLIYGAFDLKTGAISSHMQVLDRPFLNHSVQHAGGLFAKDCGELLSGFFRDRR